MRGISNKISHCVNHSSYHPKHQSVDSSAVTEMNGFASSDHLALLTVLAVHCIKLHQIQHMNVILHCIWDRRRKVGLFFLDKDQFVF